MADKKDLDCTESTIAKKSAFAQKSTFVQKGMYEQEMCN
jgi:hypothetical protein